MIKIKKISEDPTLFWILELYIPTYQIAMGAVDLEGHILATSKQVWNCISTYEKDGETLSRSCFIGPTVLHGHTSRGRRKVKILTGVIFDATELRPDKPIPLLDMIYPVIIDPMAKSDIDKARACFGGLHKDIYKIFIDAINSGVYQFPERLSILDISQKKLINFDKENLAQYMIVELNPVLKPNIDTFNQFVEVYDKTLEYMLSAKECYFFL